MGRLEDAEPAPRHKLTHPTGWEPSLEWTDTGGVISTGPLEHEPDDALWEHLIGDWGLSPRSVRIIPGSVQIRAWDAQTPNGIERLRYYRARIEPLARISDPDDVAALCKMIEKRKPKAVQAVGGERTMLVALSDWQIGKAGERGGGTPETCERILRSLDRLVDQVKQLRKVGRAPDSVALVGLGDMVEQCSGHYAMQTFNADLDRREQMRVARRLILAYVEAMVDLGLPVVLGAVPGNHGENRNSSGKAYTTWTDNDDLAVFETVGEILSANPARYGGVNVPLGAIADDLTMTLELSGVAVGFAHGHQIRSGGPEKWWQGQALGRQKIADASIMVLGHKHHLYVSESSGRTVMQCPAQDGGSYWWTAQTGNESPAGLLSVVVGAACGPRGWDDLAIL